MRERLGRPGCLGNVTRGVLAGVAVLALAGCDTVGDRTGRLADDAASRAAGEVEQAVRDQVDAALERFGGRVDVQRICELVADGRLSDRERERLEAAVAVGDQLGLPSEVTDGARRLLDGSDGSTDRVTELADACGDAPSPSTGS